MRLRPVTAKTQVKTPESDWIPGNPRKTKKPTKNPKKISREKHLNHIIHLRAVFFAYLYSCKTPIYLYTYVF